MRSTDFAGKLELKVSGNFFFFFLLYIFKRDTFFKMLHAHLNLNQPKYKKRLCNKSRIMRLTDVFY